MARRGPAAAEGARPAHEASVEERRELERALLDAERIMMQTVQTSLSLIGFGFTIAEFFNGVGVGPADARSNARLVGEALLVLGLLLLALGIWSHTRYRGRLVRRIRRLGGARLAYGMRYRDTPSFIVAILLLVVGVLTLAMVLYRRVF
jgi:putative membrane protein